MSIVEAPSTLFDEIATLFASGPTPQDVLDFRPSDAAIQRASELLDLNRRDELDEDLRHELDQYEQAELLMRLVKARIRVDQTRAS
jgi:CBS-domain-containing membrane protein